MHFLHLHGHGEPSAHGRSQPAHGATRIRLVYSCTLYTWDVLPLEKPHNKRVPTTAGDSLAVKSSAKACMQLLPPTCVYLLMSTEFESLFGQRPTCILCHVDVYCSALTQAAALPCPAVALLSHTFVAVPSHVHRDQGLALCLV
jgi:hypothetical protein